jgi:hypothetical protein
VPDGEALGNGVTVAVGTGVVCSGVTVAVGWGPAGTLGLNHSARKQSEREILQKTHLKKSEHHSENNLFVHIDSSLKKNRAC